MINTTIILDGKKEVIAFNSDSGTHELRFIQNDEAVIGEKCNEEIIDRKAGYPLLTLRFLKKESVESVIKQLESVRDQF